MKQKKLDEKLDKKLELNVLDAGSKLESNWINNALDLMNEIKVVPTTEVSEHVYGDKRAKSKLNQKKTGVNKLYLDEAMQVVAFYINLSNDIVRIIERNQPSFKDKFEMRTD